MKGQTAVEYLMTYGWAILIILIVAGVLAYYGIFAPAGFLAPTARGFGQIQVLNPWSISASDATMTLNVQNRVGGPITFTSVSYTTEAGQIINATTFTGTSAVDLTSGSSGVIVTTIPDAIPSGKKTGDSYTVTVVIGYTYSGQPFTSTGTLSGTYS